MYHNKKYLENASRKIKYSLNKIMYISYIIFRDIFIDDLI